jgi:hypothetical protein
MKKNKIILLSVLIISVVALALLFDLITHPKGDRYYLPELYGGWVCVHYNVTGAPPLKIEDGYLVHKVPPSGVITTSSEPRLSPKRDDYYYYAAEGVRPAKGLQLGGGYSKGREGETKFSFYFWVSSGNKEFDYENYVKNRDLDSDPECGPWKTK